MLHNKYKPTSFKGMLGSKGVFEKLQGYIDTKDVPHCLLFYGQRGCGKSSSSEIIAKSIPNAYIEIVDASVDNGVAVSRGIASNLSSIPIGYTNKVYILEEIHSVSDKFYDALLLSTNEPPDNVYFIIVSTELSKIRATIKSRFVKFNFKPPEMKSMRDYLSNICATENITTDRKVLSEICRKNNNLPRDCMTDLELLIGVDDVQTQLELIASVEEQNVNGYEIAKILKKGNWDNVAKLLKSVDTSEVECVRRTILAYYKNVLLSGKVRGAEVIAEFENPFFDSGVAGLALHCYDCC